jgi:hypothetical protein
MLFSDLFNQTLDLLEDGYENHFKHSINYQVLKEDIKRQQKLYEVLIEGNLISNT